MLLVMLINLFFGEYMWDISYNNQPEWYVDGVPTNKCTHYTMLFNMFMFMQIFNLLNARKIGIKEFNIFQRFFNNWMFLLIITFVTCFQILVVQYAGKFARVGPLTSRQHAACIIWGLGTWVVGAALKATPAEWVDKIPVSVDETKTADSDKILATYQRYSKKEKKPEGVKPEDQ